MKSARDIYEWFKTILALTILITQFYIMWMEGWYILFFILLTLILTDVFFGDKLKEYLFKKISNRMLEKYHLN